MAVIQPYNDSISASGQLNVQANPNAFGANVGAALQGIGNVGMEMYDIQKRQEIQQELTNVYVDTSDARSQLLSALKQKASEAPPGDLTFVPNFKQTIDDTLTKLSERYTTPSAQREFARVSASIQNDFLTRAIGEQARLAALGVQNDNTRISTNNGSVVYNDPSMLDSVLKQRIQEIDNPESIYAQLPRTDRDKLKLDTEMELRKAAMMGQVKANPELFLAKVSPETLAKFRQTDRTVGAMTTATPPVNGKVAGLAPVIQETAQKYGVDANIMTAQIMQESRGNSKAVSPKGAAGVAQFMPETASRYGVNVSDDASSIRGQANYMSDLLKMFGGDYQKALAAYNWGEGNVQKAVNKLGVNWLSGAPSETKNYVATVMKNAGVQAVTGQPVMTDTTPVKVGDRNFDMLPWHDQYSIIQTAQQHVNANQVRDQQKIADAERKRKEAESTEMKSMLIKLEEGNLTPDMVLQSRALDASSSMVMLNAIRSKANKLDDTKPEVLNDVLSQVIGGQVTDPQALWGYVGKGLSLNDIQKLQGIVNGKGSPLVEKRKAFMSMAKSEITGFNPVTGIADPEGDKQYYLFLNELDQVIADKQKSGVGLADLLDSGANNREYLGWLVDKYKRSPKQRMEAAANIVRQSASNVAPNVAPRQPGETPEQYLARTGGK